MESKSYLLLGKYIGTTWKLKDFFIECHSGLSAHNSTDLSRYLLCYALLESHMTLIITILPQLGFIFQPYWAGSHASLHTHPGVVA